MQIASLRKFLGLSASVCLVMSSGAWAASEVLDYSIRWSTVDDRYHVYMRPTETPSPDKSTTGQITILVPTNDAEENQPFNVNGLMNHVDGVTWTEDSPIRAPLENPAYDYFSFYFSSATHADAFGWQAGQEVEVFSFVNSGSCLGPVTVLNNDTDPFVVPVNNGGENSEGTNPGNQFTNAGWSPVVGDTNNYRTNYGSPADCRHSLDDDNDGLKTGDEIALGSDPDNSDTDGDGLLDGFEAGNNPLSPVDTDGDSKPNLLDPDDDNDGIPTKSENYNGDNTPVNDDTDGDGIPDYLDTDDDGDSILTSAENYNGTTPMGNDSDGDNKPDYLDTDDDNDGVLTRYENYNDTTPLNNDTDNDGKPDYLDSDDDGDNKYSADENNDPNHDGRPSDAVDTDGDGVVDYLDINDNDGPKGDADNDGISNADEQRLGSDPNNPDDDGDGVLSINEAYQGNSPLNQDSDGDGKLDFMDPDDDNDTVPTKDENYNGGTPENDDTDNDGTPDYLDTDDDNDGLLTRHENYNSGTPENDDTDNDGVPDYLDTDDDGDGKLTKDELPDQNGDKDPADAVDSDGDSIPDYRDVTNDLAAIQVRVMLQGAFDGSTGMMADDLRRTSLIPSDQPYNDAKFAYNGNETASAGVMNVTGNDAVVDWVLIELRDKSDNTSVVARRAGLVQRDGDVVDSTTGSKTLLLEGVAPDDYYVSIRHRNHLGAMASGLVRVQSTPPLVDFTSVNTPVYGDNARTAYESIALLWAGNADGNNRLIANGPGQDSSVLIGSVLRDRGNVSLSSNYILSGYSNNDLNMDGKTIVAGPGNDLNLLLRNILLHPGNSTLSANFIVQERLP